MKLLVILFAVLIFSCKRLYAELPVIDMAPLLNPNNFTLEEIYKSRMDINYACSRWGFFQVINHGELTPLVIFLISVNVHSLNRSVQ